MEYLTASCSCCCSKMWTRALIDSELDALITAFHAKGIANASYTRGQSIISLICNVKRTSEILERVSGLGLKKWTAFFVYKSCRSQLPEQSAPSASSVHP